MKSEHNRQSFRYTGSGAEWIQKNSWFSVASGTALNPHRLNENLRRIISPLNISGHPEFLIRDRQPIGSEKTSVRVFRQKIVAFDVFVMLDEVQNALLWCEIHPHAPTMTQVTICEVIDRPSFTPAFLYIVEIVPGLRLFASGPPQASPFSVGSRAFVSCMAWTLQSHRHLGHSHIPGERGSGGLVNAFHIDRGNYADEVFFHGEARIRPSIEFLGAQINCINCEMDFGDKGAASLPIFAPQISLGRLVNDPLLEREFVQGIGALHVLQSE